LAASCDQQGVVVMCNGPTTANVGQHTHPCRQCRVNVTSAILTYARIALHCPSRLCWSNGIP